MLAEESPPVIHDAVLPVVIEALGSIPSAMQVNEPLLAIYTHRVAPSVRGVITVRVDGSYAFPVSTRLAGLYERVEQPVVEARSQAPFRFSELASQYQGFEELRHKRMLELNLAPVLDELQWSKESSLSEVL